MLSILRTSGLPLKSKPPVISADRKDSGSRRNASKGSKDSREGRARSILRGDSGRRQHSPYVLANMVDLVDDA